MSAIFLQGFLLGAGLIIAIGAQNAFILRQGLLREHVFILCLTCSLSDALLIGVGVAGLGGIVSANLALLQVVKWAGAAFLFAYALFAFRRMMQPSALETDAQRKPSSLKTALATCLAFTFLNPHVYLDTVVLVGSLSGRFEGGDRFAFGAGAMLASFVWFFALGYGARLLTPVFARPSAWRVLDAIIGIIMSALAISLLV